MIALNVIVLGFQMAFPEASDGFKLQFGTINLIQWVSAMIMHIGIGHLLGNK